MNEWQWFWTLVGFIAFIIVLIFLFFYQPFESLFTLIINAISFSNVIFWVALLIGIIGFCVYHWHAYRVHIVQQQNVEAMVLSSLRGSTFVAILISGAAALQAVQILCVHMLQQGYSVNAEFGERLGAVAALVVLTGVFCIIFWLLKVVHASANSSQTR